MPNASNYISMIQIHNYEQDYELKYLYTIVNESTAGADASVEMPKLHNMRIVVHTSMHANSKSG